MYLAAEGLRFFVAETLPGYPSSKSVWLATEGARSVEAEALPVEWRAAAGARSVESERLSFFQSSRFGSPMAVGDSNAEMRKASCIWKASRESARAPFAEELALPGERTDSKSI